jgi:hypothetical protein
LIEEQYQKGSCNQSLDVKNLNRMEIPIPPMETQLHVIRQMEAANGKITGLQNIVDIMKFTDIPLRFQIGLDMSLHLAEWVKFGDMFDLIKGEMPSGKVVETEQEFDGIEFVKFITGAKDESWKIINVNKDVSYCEGENVFISENGNGNCRPVKYYNGNCNYSNLVSLLKCKKN